MGHPDIRTQRGQAVSTSGGGGVSARPRQRDKAHASRRRPQCKKTKDEFFGGGKRERGTSRLQGKKKPFSTRERVAVPLKPSP